MEVSVTGTLEKTLQSKLKSFSSLSRFFQKVWRETQQACSLKILLFLSFYKVQDLSDAQCVVCLPWLQVPGTLQLFWAQVKQHDYIDEWISTWFPWRWERVGFNSCGYMKQCLVRCWRRYSSSVWVMAGWNERDDESTGEAFQQRRNNNH